MVRLNPRVQRNTLLLLGAAVAGPALVVAGVKYPGGLGTKTFLALSGVGVSAATYHYLQSDIRALLTSSD